MKQPLPAKPNLAQLKHQAKDLLHQMQAGDPQAIARSVELHPRIQDRSELSLSDAQLVLAREYGFASWPKLKAHVESLEEVERRVAHLQASFAAGDVEARKHLLKAAHSADRFENYDPNAVTLSEADARLLAANEKGYAFWLKYDSYIHLDPAVKEVIRAVRTGDLEGLKRVLQADPGAANPKWAPGFEKPANIPNDSTPLCCVSEGIFEGTNRKGNDYELTVELIQAGANTDLIMPTPPFASGTPLTTAVSYNALGATRALLEGGAAVDGPDGQGMPMAYAMLFGFRDIAEALAKYHPKLDLRFAAGLGDLDSMKRFFLPDGSLTEDAGSLADPYDNHYRCERTRENILSQALYCACTHHRFAAADYLLERGADLNAIVPGFDFKATILHRMAALDFGGAAAPWNFASRVPVIRFLLERGASLEVKDPTFNSTPMGWANHFGHQDVEGLFKEMR